MQIHGKFRFGGRNFCGTSKVSELFFKIKNELYLKWQLYTGQNTSTQTLSVHLFRSMKGRGSSPPLKERSLKKRACRTAVHRDRMFFLNQGPPSKGPSPDLEKKIRCQTGNGTDAEGLKVFFFHLPPSTIRPCDPSFETLHWTNINHRPTLFSGLFICIQTALNVLITLTKAWLLFGAFCKWWQNIMNPFVCPRQAFV